MPEQEPVLLQIAKRACADMMEHADSVQVFVTQYDPESKSTKHVSIGEGNWYAREGQVREWVLQNDENSRLEIHVEDEEE